MVKYFFLFILLSNNIAIAQTRPRLVGNEGAHGGDPILKEFSKYHSLLAKEYRKNSAKDVLKSCDFTSDEFDHALANIRIDPVPKVLLNGREVMAVNYFPEKNVVEIGTRRWKAEGTQGRVDLVNHEVLGYLGVELDVYTCSNQLDEILQRVTRLVGESSDPEVGLVYGLSTYAFKNDADPSFVANGCGDNTDLGQELIRRAQRNLQEKCEIRGKGRCQIISREVELEISRRPLGLVECVATVVGK